MKKKIAMISLLALVVSTITGCGLVKVVPIGQESEYTGHTTFDASLEAADSWSAVAEEITGNAQELSTLISAGTQKGTVYAISFTGTVNELNTDTPKGYLDMAVDGVSKEVRVQVGKVFSGTSIRDAQTYKNYQDFTNQTEWSQYAKTLNDNVFSNVIEPAGIDDSIAGKTVTVVGSFSDDGKDVIVVTPVSLVLE